MMKEFNCVEMKRKAQGIIHQRLEGLSHDEKLRYWQERDEVLQKRLEALKKKKAEPA